MQSFDLPEPSQLLAVRMERAHQVGDLGDDRGEAGDGIRWERFGEGLWRRLIDGRWDYVRACRRHAWASPDGVDRPQDVALCPFCRCELEARTGRRRYEAARDVFEAR